jgi:hypothetical protein
MQRPISYFPYWKLAMPGFSPKSLNLLELRLCICGKLVPKRRSLPEVTFSFICSKVQENSVSRKVFNTGSDVYL